MTEKKRLLLVDGHAVAYRAFYAIPPLNSPSGEPTNAVLGFANMFLKAIGDYEPDYVVAAFDKGRTFRHDEYQEYKAHRKETPEDLRPQIGHIQELLAKLGVPVYVEEGYEADDILGTLSLEASEQGLETIIVTGDSDTFQLVSDDVKVLTPRRSLGDVKLYDAEAVRERYGLDPEQLVDLKALMGDSSDNIPGVRGVGEKTATRLLKKYGTVEAVFEHLEEVKQTRFRNALERGEESAFQSKHLVQIVRDMDVDLDLDKSHWGAFDRSEVMLLLRDLGFHSLVERIPNPRGGDPRQLGLFDEETGEEVIDTDYHTVSKREQLEQLVSRLTQAERIAIDTETTGTDTMRADLVGISLSDAKSEAWYIPVGHMVRRGGAGQLPMSTVQELLGPVLADKEIVKVFHNAKFDRLILRRHGLPVAGTCHDTMLAAWLLEPSGRGIGLKEQAWQRLGIEMLPIDELIKQGRKRLTMDQVLIERAAPYACADADMTLRLLSVMRRELEALDQWELYAEMELPLVPVLMDMETVGMSVDRDYLQEMSDELSERLAEIEEAVYEMAEHPFNLRSTQQLGEVLFEELGLPVVRRTKTGYSTAADVLQQLENEHPIIASVLEYRELEKLRGTYADALIDLINPETGRIHTSFNQTGTSTGRLSSSDPNLQNIPVRTELGRRVRKAFVAGPGHLLLSCDYSQVELRLLAHLSQDPELLAAFHRDEDVHATTAAAVFDIPLDEVTYEQRSLAKAINFGLMYGMSAYGLSARTDLSVEEATRFVEAYFERFSKVREYLDDTIARAHRDGYVETIMGRRRYFPGLAQHSSGQHERRAERAAVNMPIQGSAADIIKLAMIELDRHLREKGSESHMLLQVHDELVLEVPEKELEATRELVVHTMRNAYRLDVSLKVDVAVGQNWMELK